VRIRECRQTWRRTGCGSTRQTTVTITLTNNAPASGLSPYVTGRIDSHSYPVKRGDNRLEVSYLATQGTLARLFHPLPGQG